MEHSPKRIGLAKLFPQGGRSLPSFGIVRSQEKAEGLAVLFGMERTLPERHLCWGVGDSRSR
jgi:hypothetical protein